MKKRNSWHLLRDDEVLRELSTDMYSGLSTSEAKRRRMRHGPNGIWHVKRRSAWEIASETMLDLPTLLLIISAVVAALFDRRLEAGVIAAILVISGIVRTVTYFRANRIFEDMANEKIPVSAVIRDGAIRLIPANEIVVGDIIFLEMGDTVPCDGRVLSDEETTVSEKGITENKTPVKKFNTVIKTQSDSGEIPCEFRSNIMFAGSAVLEGSARIVAIACGKSALISMQKGGVEITPAENLPVIEKLRGRSKKTSLIMLAAVMCFTWLSLFISREHTLSEVFLSTMAMAVAAMSEFMTAIGYIIVAITLRDAADGKTDGVVDENTARLPKDKKESARKPAASRLVIRKPEKLDDISMPDMAVFCGAQFFKSGKAELYSYRVRNVSCPNEVFAKHKTGRIVPLSELLTLAAAATMASQNGLAADSDSRRPTENTSLVERALDAYRRRTGDEIVHDYYILDHCAAGERRAIGIDCSLISRHNKNRLVICGPVFDVYNCCSRIDTIEGVRDLTQDDKYDIFRECATLEASGTRVIAVARKRAGDDVIDPLSIRSGMTFVGFFSLAQEPEIETNSYLKSNVEFVKKAGIIPVLFTERPDNDLYYCKRFGLFGASTPRVSASDILSVNVDSLTTSGLIVSFTDLGGIYLTSAYENCLKHLRGTAEKDGEGSRKVAALGMEIWDAGALKSSDFGVAVSRSEYQSVPEVLSRKASVVVYPEEGRAEPGFGGFSGFIRSIKYARRAIENIDSAKQYITAAQSARLILILLSVFNLIPMMNAVFILAWGLIFDFATALVMAFENNGRSDGYIRSRFMPVRDGYDAGERKAAAEKKETWVSIVSGIFWGLATAFIVPLSKWMAPVLGYEFSYSAATTLLASSVVLSGTVFALEVMKRNSLFSSRNPNVAQLVYCICALVAAALPLLAGFIAKTIGGVPCLNASVLVLAPLILVMAAWEIYYMIRRKKQ